MADTLQDAGLPLQGARKRTAADIGWVRDLTVGRLMPRDVPLEREDTMLGDFRRNHPLGSNDLVVAVDGNGRYAGIVPLNRAHALALDQPAGSTSLSTLLVHKDATLLSSMNVKEAVPKRMRSLSSIRSRIVK